MPGAARRATSASKLLTHGAPVLALVTAGFAGLVHLQSGKLEIRVSGGSGARCCRRRPPARAL